MQNQKQNKKHMAWLLQSDGTTGSCILNVSDINQVSLAKASDKIVRNADRKDDKKEEDEDDYIVCIGRFWLILHVDNDKDPSRSTLPINKALKNFIPSSVFVGDLLVCCTRDGDSDELRSGNWQLSEFAAHLSKHDVIQSKDQLLFRVKDDEFD